MSGRGAAEAGQRGRTEIAEVQEQLSSASVDVKRQAVRRIISAMTLGKDVSLLFPAVVRNMETPHLELKKLIYLYIINYARTQPDLALLAVNSFCKDASDRRNPLLRALAVRTMGCLRIKQIAQHLVEPLRAALGDEDPYVRKTGVLCVAKLFDAHPALVLELGLHRVVAALLADGNPLVISNAMCCLAAMALRGAAAPPLDAQSVARVLTVLGDAAEWSQAVMLDAVAGYAPQGAAEAERILERVAVYLTHRNPAVVLAAAKVVFRLADRLGDGELARAYCRRAAPALVTLLAAEPEIRFAALKSVAVLADRRPAALAEELPGFFCHFGDPFFVKAEKLEVMVKLASPRNIDQVLHELRDYALEVDTDFVRRAVRAVGRLAVRVESAAEKCVQTLWECLKARGGLVLQEAIVAIRDIFRRYPGEYEGLLAELCAEVRVVDEPEAKAALCWIIGEHAEQLENAAEILGRFYLDTFPEEPPAVQLQVVAACVRVCLVDPPAGSPLVLRLFGLIEACENPDVRARGYFYWRLLKAAPELAREVVCAARPPLLADSAACEPDLLEVLFEQLNTLACVYGQPPGAFVRPPPPAPLPEDEPPAEARAPGAAPARVAAPSSALDLLGEDIPDAPAAADRHIRVPDSQVVSPEHEGFDKGKTGLQVAASFQLRGGSSTVLRLCITNHAPLALSSFYVKFRANSYCLAPVSQELELDRLEPGQTGTAQVAVAFSGPPSREPPEFPFRVHVALNTSLDIFVFHVPCSLSALLRPAPAYTEAGFRELLARPNLIKTQQSFPCAHLAQWAENPQLCTAKFADNNLAPVARQAQGDKTLLSFVARMVDGFDIPLQILLQRSAAGLGVHYLVPEPSLVRLFGQAIRFIIDY